MMNQTNQPTPPFASQLVELRKPPMDVDSVLAANNPVSGLLGAALGGDSAESRARIDEAKKNAKDLTGLVRKKAKDEKEAQEAADKNSQASAEEKTSGTASAAPAPAPAPANGTKRKAEDPAADEDGSKKPKVQAAEAQPEAEASAEP